MAALRTAHVQPHLSGVDVGEKVVADETDQSYGGGGEDCKSTTRQDPVLEDPFEQAVIGVTQFLKA